MKPIADEIESICSQLTEIGDEFSEAVSRIITNEGEHPVTIQECFCDYSHKTKAGSILQFKEAMGVGSEIGRGESCRSFLTINRDPIGFEVLHAVDSTGKSWNPDRKELERFREKAREFWMSFRDSN